MRKLLTFCVIVIALAVISVGVTYGVNEYDSVNINGSALMGSMADSQQTEPFDDTVTVAITAVGDCTLGTDAAFGSVGTFTAEATANNNDYSYFMRNVRSYFEKDDLTIANFEGTLSDTGVRAAKQFAFRGKPEYTGILYGSSVEAVNLANNHSMDYGVLAYEDTKKSMSDFGITSFGMEDAAIREINGIRVGLIGINALNRASVANYPNVLKQLKSKNPDLIVASFHWGIEKSAYANREQIALAHGAVDNGADLVIGHHPHVLQGVEKYKGKYIVYSLGNFCFGGNKNPVDKDTMIFRQTFSFKDGMLLPREEVSIVPCSISSVKNRNNYQPTPLWGKEFERVRAKIINRSSGFSGMENITFVESEICF